MTVIENINIAYVSQDLSLLSSADADGTKDLRYLSVFSKRSLNVNDLYSKNFGLREQAF